MNNNKKRWIVILIAVLLIAIILIVVLVNNNEENNTNNNEQQEQIQTNEEKYSTELEGGLSVNTSEEFSKTKTYGNLEISNIQYTYSNGITLLLADVTNKGTSTHELEVVKLTILGENDEVITEIEPPIGKIEPGDTIQINASINADLTNAKDFKVEAAD